VVVFTRAIKTDFKIGGTSKARGKEMFFLFVVYGNKYVILVLVQKKVEALYFSIRHLSLLFYYINKRGHIFMQVVMGFDSQMI